MSQHKNGDGWPLSKVLLFLVATIMLFGCTVTLIIAANHAMIESHMDNQFRYTDPQTGAVRMVRPADVLRKVEMLEDRLKVSPADVLKEVGALKAQLESLEVNQLRR